MARRLLSHLLITLAIFSLSATYFIWVIDSALLNPAKLSKALKDGGVPSAIANIIPEQASKGDGDKGECQNNQPNNDQVGNSLNNNQPGNQQNGQQNGCLPKVQTEQDKQDEADMKAKIAAVVTPDYVNEKLEAITSTVITFMKNGKPSPTIDISDFPAKLRASGVETGDDIDKNFNKPIELNNKGSLDALPKAYKSFKLAKYLGALLFVLLLVAEWFVAAKGDKLHRIGRIFLHAGFWYTLWWVGLAILPSKGLPALKEKIGAEASISTLVDAIVKSIQHLFSMYFLSFAIVCWVLAISLYLVRHVRKHVDKIEAVPAAKGKAKPLPNKR